MIYGEILKTKTVEKWLSMLRFLALHGLFNADSKLPKNYYKLYGYTRNLHVELQVTLSFILTAVFCRFSLIGLRV